ncbi:MAG TPA: hypothetical protein VMI75_13960 [Polyangiaceae bacterium]|nr:hypothetical protein [Polyangiaceae bacterium]
MSIHAVGEPRVPLPSPPAAETPSSAPAAPANPEQPSAFGRLVRGLGAEVQRGETLVHHAIASASGGDLDPAQLIALQAGVYRYAEAVDLAARLVDHATTGLKTVIQGT